MQANQGYDSQPGCLIRIAEQTTKTIDIQELPTASGADSLQVDANMTEINQELTTFVEDGNVQGTARAPVDRLLGQYTDVRDVADVNKYLGRPQQLSTGALALGSQQVILEEDIGQRLWSSHVHYPKVLGAYGMRATSCFKLTVSSTPYQCGALKLAFQPQDPVSQMNYTQLSQLAGVMLDYPDNSSAEFKVPFVCYRDFVQLNDFQSHSIGKLILYQYLPFTAAAEAGPAYWTVHWWLEDVELIGAMPSSIAADYLTARQDIINALASTKSGVRRLTQVAEDDALSVTAM